MDDKEVIEHALDDEAELNDKADMEESCEKVTEEKAVEQESVQKEAEKDEENVTDTTKFLDDADLSQSIQEFIKQRSDIFSKGSNISYNITINQISGDNISGSAQKIDFGEQNEFGDVSIDGKNNANDPSPEM